MATSSRHHTSLTATLLTAAGGAVAVLPYTTTTVSARRPSRSTSTEQPTADPSSSHQVSDGDVYEGWKRRPKAPKQATRSADDSRSFYGYAVEELFGTVKGPDGECLYHWGLGCGEDVSEGPKNGTLDCGATENIVNYTYECQPTKGKEQSQRFLVLLAVFLVAAVAVAAVATVVAIVAAPYYLVYKAVKLISRGKGGGKGGATPYPPATVTGVKSGSKSTERENLKSLGRGGGSTEAPEDNREMGRSNRPADGRRKRGERKTSRRGRKNTHGKTSRSRRLRRNGEEDWTAEDMADATTSPQCRIGGKDTLSVSCTTFYAVLACVLLFTVAVVLGVWKWRGQKTAAAADLGTPSPAQIKAVQ